MSGFRFRPYDLMPYRVEGTVHPPRSELTGSRGTQWKSYKAPPKWGATLVAWKEVPGTPTWAVLVEQEGQERQGIFHESGRLWVDDGKGSMPRWAQRSPRGQTILRQRRAHRAGWNPRHSSRAGGGRAGPTLMSVPPRGASITAAPGIGPSSAHSIWDAGAHLMTTGKYPGGGAVSSLSSTTPLVVKPLGPATSFPATVSAKAASASLPGGTYLRQSFASQAATPPGGVTEAKLYKQLLDPQLWRLADGGDRWAMHELHRRGPAHYLPARPNPPARGFEFMHADDNEYWAEWAMARQGIPHRGIGVGPGAWPIGARQNPHNPSHLKKLAILRRNPKKKGEYRKHICHLAKMHNEGIKLQPGYVSAAIQADIEAEAARQRLRPNPSAVRGLEVHRGPGSLPSYGSGPAGGYSKTERDRLPKSWFLKPETRSWPVADPRHFEIAIQYMTAARGIPSEYPMLIRRLAKLWPVEKHAALWRIYTRDRAKIAKKADRKMPTVAQLRQNPRRRRRR